MQSQKKHGTLAKECYSMKMDLLTNATVVDDAIRFVSNNSSKDKAKSKLSANNSGHDEDKDQIEEEQKEEEKTGEITTINQIF